MTTKFLFIDNFRGFTDTYVPILDVNFLVGQNSTGKTSVIGLLKLLSTPRILWGREFGDNDVNFGHFKDMVSAHSEDRSYFRIGVISEQHGAKGAARGAAMLFTYKEEEGLPRLAQFTATVGTRQISLRFFGKQIWYKSVDLPTDTTIDSLLNMIVPQWVAEHARDDGSSNYRKLALPKGYFDNRYHLFSALTFAIDSETKGKGSARFFFPMGPELIWIAPIRTKPKRTYDEFQTEFSPEGTHTPYLIRRILQSKDAERFHKFISAVGEASGLFQSIKIRKFGKGVTAPFEVDAVVDEKALNLSTVGYGVSQSLPVFVELLTSPHESCFAIQQPEVHLHPRAQAALGDVFFEMAENEKKRFLIETHSDFTIDRFRMNYRKRPVPKLRSQILFFERKLKRNTVTAINIGKDGDLSDQPESYRSFFVKEEMHVLGL